MDGVLALRVNGLMAAAGHSLIAMRRKGMALNPAYISLKDELEGLRNLIAQRENNKPKQTYAVRFLLNKELMWKVDGEKRPWLIEVGDVFVITNYVKDGYVVQSRDVSKATFTLRMTDEGELYERITID